MKKFLRKNIWIIVFIILLLIPFTIQSNFLFFGTWLRNFIRVGNSSSWLGFWGSYLGSILTITFTYMITRIQIKETKKADYRNAIKMNELNSTISLLQDAAYLQNNVYSLVEETASNSICTMYSELQIKRMCSMYDFWNTFIQRYNDNVVVVQAFGKLEIADEMRELREKFIEITKIMNKDFSAKISNSIKNKVKGSIPLQDKKTFKDANDKCNEMFTMCENFTKLVSDYYEKKKSEIY